jgi:hypothetical protein
MEFFFVGHPSEWTDVVLAVSTAAIAVFTLVLAAGVIFAWQQLKQDAKFNKAVQATSLITEWNDPLLEDFRSKRDVSVSYQESREKAKQGYMATKGDAEGRDYWAYRVQALARVAERIELFLERKLADEDLLINHLGYDIVSSYYILQDVLKQRTYDEDYLYDSYRALAQRVQSYAKQHDLDIREELVSAVFPELVSHLDEQRDRAEAVAVQPQ